MIIRLAIQNGLSLDAQLMLNGELRKDDGGKRADESKHRSLVSNLLYLTII